MDLPLILFFGLLAIALEVVYRCVRADDTETGENNQPEIFP